MLKKVLKDMLKKFDYFGVVFTFKYKSKEKYRSATGGLCFLLFLGIALSYSVINAVPLLKREKMSVINYSMQTKGTDQLNFLKYSFSFGVGISSCSSLKDMNMFWKLFDFEINYVKYLKENGEKRKEKIPISYDYCNHASFYNSLNSSFDALGLNTMFCPTNINYTIQGIYTDAVFEYIEILMKIKNENDDSKYQIKKLFSDECNLDIYYTDFAFDLFDFKDPATSYINHNFLTLKYTEVMKMNVYFKLMQFNSYENFLFDNSKKKELMSFSSYDLYSNYKGESRFEDKPSDYQIFAKIYVRAALEREIIERRYQKLTECAADVSSILSASLLLIFLFITFINKFYANESVMHKIFQFNNIERTKRKHKDIGKIINKNVYLFNEPESKTFAKEIENVNTETTLKHYDKDKAKKTDITDSLKAIDIKTESEITNFSDIKKKAKKSLFRTTPEESRNSAIYYNLFEILCFYFFPKCSWKNLRKKNILTAKGISKLFFQLDVLNYLKQMQIIDIINYSLLETNENIIVQFLSKPSISLAQKKDLHDKIHSLNDINATEADELYTAIRNIYNLKEKTNFQKRLLRLTKIEMGKLMKKMKHKD